MPPKFFITHSWKDMDFARWLCDNLRANGLDGFFDAHSVNPGDSIPSRIERGLKECDVYIPVFSPDALKSNWCDWEIDMAITMNRTRQGRPRIIPVIAKPCDVPDRLMHLLYINFVGRSDDALRELLTKGFNLPEAPSAQLALPMSPHAQSKNWLLACGAVVTLAILVLVLALWRVFAQPTTPTPRSVAGPTLAPATADETLLPVVIATGTSKPTRPSVAPSLTNTRIPIVAPSPTPTLGIGSTKTAKDGSLLMFVPAGEFPMGKPATYAEAPDAPPHTVYLDAFWMGKYEVTNALYKKCLDAGRCAAPGYDYWPNGTIPIGKENHPVQKVSWNNAVDYATWVGGRLPTEAEWEKAACWDDAKKAKYLYPWGNVFDAQRANTKDDPRVVDTAPVGKYSPQGDSPYGISDMTGNVAEWVADWYSPTYYASSPKNNPKGPDEGPWHVYRGGSWVNANSWECASRDRNDPQLQHDFFGFRVAFSFP